MPKMVSTAGSSAVRSPHTPRSHATVSFIALSLPRALSSALVKAVHWRCNRRPPGAERQGQPQEWQFILQGPYDAALPSIAGAEQQLDEGLRARWQQLQAIEGAGRKAVQIGRRITQPLEVIRSGLAACEPGKRVHDRVLALLIVRDRQRRNQNPGISSGRARQRYRDRPRNNIHAVPQIDETRSLAPLREPPDAISMRLQCVLVPRIQNHSRHRRGAGGSRRGWPTHRGAIAPKLLVAVTADADRRAANRR